MVYLLFNMATNIYAQCLGKCYANKMKVGLNIRSYFISVNKLVELVAGCFFVEINDQPRLMKRSGFWSKTVNYSF